MLSTFRPFAAALLATLALLLPAPAPADETPVVPALPREPVPQAPAGLILDQAHVLLPEIAARLSAKLADARAHDVHVYVATVSSLRVPASKQLERLEELAKDYSNTWNKHTIGAVILFDDESGMITLELSKPTSERFTTFAVEDVLRIPLGEAQKSGLARDKIQRFGEITAVALSKLQEDYLKETHRARIGNFIMGGIALLGIGLTIFSAVAKSNGPSVAAPSHPINHQPPVDF